MIKKLKGKLTTWAQLRFSIIGELLASPPKKGELCKKLETLAGQCYQHPTEDEWTSFGVSTIERWYYEALGSDDPIKALSRKVRSDAGKSIAMSPQLLDILKKQYQDYPNWTYQLHSDNLSAKVAKQPELGQAPSYCTVKRCMKQRGWYRKKGTHQPKTDGQKQAQERLEKREVRSFESEYVHSLWHLDFHHGRRVVDVNGRYHTPMALCILDDCSRLCCHIQWYLSETAEALIHGLSQAFHKRGLPRSLMSDNGSAMIADETREGLLRLGIMHEKTLPYSPYQNGKQEAFWSQLEGRLLAMLSKVQPLTLQFLNHASQAWVEVEYNSKPHQEIILPPLEKMLKGPNVSRQSPDSQSLRFAFTTKKHRKQRRSDGTVPIKGIRFEVPSAFRHFEHLSVRYQSFDLSTAYLVDKRTDELLSHIYPQDKTKNADGHRRALEPVSKDQSSSPKSDDSDPIPPLLRNILADYAATGLPPAYLPKEENIPPTDPKKENNNE